MTALEQRMSALDNANRIRFERAQIRREIGSLPFWESRRRAAEVLADPSPECEGMSVYQLLVACRHVGYGKATYLLAHAQIPQHKKLGDLTDRQRDLVHDFLASSTSFSLEG